MDGEGTKAARREVEQKRYPEKARKALPVLDVTFRNTLKAKRRSTINGTVLWKFLWKFLLFLSKLHILQIYLVKERTVYSQK
jgi:hypothetical protein